MICLLLLDLHDEEFHSMTLITIFPLLAEATTTLVTEVVCEDDTASLTCPGGTISNLCVFYGRDDTGVCPGTLSNMDCGVTKITNIESIENRCNGQPDCAFTVSTANFGFQQPDSCIGVYKFARITFFCTNTDLLTFLQAKLDFSCSLLDFLDQLIPAITALFQALFDRIKDWFYAFFQQCCVQQMSYW